MIINKPGSTFTYDGTTFTIGSTIVGTKESEYEGLYGSITEIRDGEDKETENETPDIYCSFDPPALSYDIEELEKTFSELYQYPKKLEDIILDEVIMAPEMIMPLEDFEKSGTALPVYMLMEDSAIKGNSFNRLDLFADYAHAKYQLGIRIFSEQESGCLEHWEGNEYLCLESGKDSYEAYLDGDFINNHYRIWIERKDISLTDDCIRLICKMNKGISPKENPDKIR